MVLRPSPAAGKVGWSGVLSLGDRGSGCLFGLDSGSLDIEKIVVEIRLEDCGVCEAGFVFSVKVVKVFSEVWRWSKRHRARH